MSKYVGGFFLLFGFCQDFDKCEPYLLAAICFFLIEIIDLLKQKSPPPKEIRKMSNKYCCAGCYIYFEVGYLRMVDGDHYCVKCAKTEDEEAIREFARRVRKMVREEGVIDVKLMPTDDPNITLADYARGALALLDGAVVKDSEAL